MTTALFNNALVQWRSVEDVLNSISVPASQRLATESTNTLTRCQYNGCSAFYITHIKGGQTEATVSLAKANYTNLDGTRRKH